MVDLIDYYCSCRPLNEEMEQVRFPEISEFPVVYQDNSLAFISPNNFRILRAFNSEDYLYRHLALTRAKLVRNNFRRSLSDIIDH